MSDIVLCSVEGGIATLTLNRPAKLNAINYAMADRLLALLDQLERDAAVRVLVLTGAGARAFSAGADIAEFSRSVAAGPDIAMRDFVQRGQAMTMRLETFPKPVIAAVNGLAFGGGCEITEAVHVAIASDRALFAKPEVKLGMPPTFGGSQRLPRLAGRKRALALLLTGDPFSPQRAREMGLINEVVPHDDLLRAAHTMAQRMMRHSPLALAAIIAAAQRGIDMTIAQGLQAEGEQFARLASSVDLAEGLAAWQERRDARYQGR